MENIVWIWLLAAVIFLILELLTPTLVFACFVVASVVAGVGQAIQANEILAGDLV